MENPEQAEGVGASLRRTADLLLRTLRNRAELLGVELEEEGRWVVSAVIWTAATILFAVLAITMATVTIVALSPDGVRPWVLVGFSIIYLVLAWSALVGLKKQIRSRRPPLSDTVNELKKDLEWIQPKE